MIIIDKLAYLSPIREKSPFVKTAFSLGTLLICVGARSFVLSVLILLVMGYLTVKNAKVSLYSYIKLMAAPAIFLILGTVAILMNWTNEPMDLFNIPVGTHYIGASHKSLMETLNLIVVAEASVSCLYFLSLTTPMLDIIRVMGKMKLPWLFLELTMLMYRFIFVLLEIAATITVSQKSRLSNISKMTQIKALGGLLSVLLIRALHKGNLLYDSMESRCYDGRITVLWEGEKVTKKEIISVSTYLILMLALGIVTYIRGY